MGRVMRLVVDQNRCVAAGQCVVVAPTVFDQREDDGTVIVLDAAPPPELLRDVQQAVHFCPSQAITPVDEQ